MLSTRYSILIANRRTGVVRRLTVSPRPLFAAVVVATLVPGVMVWGGMRKLQGERDAVRAELSAAVVENDNMRAAAGALTSQLGSLQGALDDLSLFTPTAAERTAMTRLPGSVQGSAMGGLSPEAARHAMSEPSAGAEAMGVVRQILDALQSHVQAARPRAERRAALARATPAIWPAMGELNSSFGFRRDPFTQQISLHPGVDLAVDHGEPVHATADGLVGDAHYQPEYGNIVRLSHGFGIETRYAHLSRFAVRPGTSIRRGHLLGYAGSTGRATGAHLHYEVWIDGRPVDPLRYLVSRDAS